MLTALLLIILVSSIGAKSNDKLARFFGNDKLQFGFGEDCYMFWRGDEGNRKNVEFRCGSSMGDPMKIVKDGSGYRVGSNGNLWLFWNGDSGDTKNAEFRRESKKGDVFWIRPQKDGQYAIGVSDCPLFWRGDEGTIKNAEFRCGETASDTFWIKGDGCKVTNVTVLSTDNEAEDDGTEVVGISIGGSCTESSHELSLAHSRAITETVGLTIGNTKEVNFAFGTSIGVKAGGNILGFKTETTVTTSFSVGGAFSWSEETTRSTTFGSATSKGILVPYSTPGAAMILGFVQRYKFNKEKLPARFLVQCKGGHEFTYDSTIALQSKTYGHGQYSSYTGTFVKEKCTEKVLHCLDETNFRDLHDSDKIREQFNSCFPPGVGKVLKRK